MLCTYDSIVRSGMGSLVLTATAKPRRINSLLATFLSIVPNARDASKPHLERFGLRHSWSANANRGVEELLSLRQAPLYNVRINRDQKDHGGRDSAEFAERVIEKVSLETDANAVRAFPTLSWTFCIVRLTHISLSPDSKHSSSFGDVPKEELLKALEPILEQMKLIDAEVLLQLDQTPNGAIVSKTGYVSILVS